MMLEISHAIVYVHAYSTAINGENERRGTGCHSHPLLAHAVRRLFENLKSHITPMGIFIGDRSHRAPEAELQPERPAWQNPGWEIWQVEHLRQKRPTPPAGMHVDAQNPVGEF
jgi:hypothetical protein